MRRVLIIGCCGAGKSTLARKLHELTDLPLTHLDQEYFFPGWEEPSKADWEQKVVQLVERPSWIIDGNYGSSMDLRIPKADTIIFMDFPRWTCLFRVMKRVVTQYGKVRPDSAPGCPERWDWDFMLYVYRFKDRKRPGILKRLTGLTSDQNLLIFKSSRQVKRYLKALENSE